MTDSGFFFRLAVKISEGYTPADSEYRAIADLDEKDAFMLLPGSDYLREKFFGREVQLCTIKNSKSGRCSEDCRFCSQSSWWETPDTPSYSLIPFEDALSGADAACNSPVNRYSMVNSGRGPAVEEIRAVASYISGFPHENGTGYCASLGIMEQSGFECLKNSGLARYHHNLEAAGSLFGSICTTHTYDERVETVKAAKASGLEICCGGIFGMGETDAHVLELALELKKIDVDAVPVNFLVPIKGTPFENMDRIRPSRCLKIISIFRYVLPEKEIIVCGGREAALKSFEEMCIWAGASGIMTGNYLTVSGSCLAKDLEMLRRTGFMVKPKHRTKG